MNGEKRRYSANGRKSADFKPTMRSTKSSSKSTRSIGSTSSSKPSIRDKGAASGKSLLSSTKRRNSSASSASTRPNRAQHSKSASRPAGNAKPDTRRSVRDAGAFARSQRASTSRQDQTTGKSDARSRRPAKKVTLLERITTSKVAITIIVAVIAVAFIGIFDLASNWNKAYGNVSVNGIAVGGKTADEIKDILVNEYSQKVSHATVTIYANEESQANSANGTSDEESRAIAEQISAEEAISSVGSWTTDALSLKATVPYDDTAAKALAIGRADGGLMERLSLFFAPKDVEMKVGFDAANLETLASEIDRTIGDPRIDTTVEVNNGEARVSEGHNGTMVDRDWLGDKISRAMLRDDVPNAFVAQAQLAQSRISTDQARATADAVNRAISNGVLFKFRGKSWLAQPALLGDWTHFDIVADGSAFKLAPRIDSSLAIPGVVNGVGATITSDDMSVTFEKSGDSISVRTSGNGNIPEVAPAVETLQSRLYGQDGIAWGAGDAGAIEIEIGESDRPETLSFEDALDLGVITVVGQYTTEFSNLEGTENRNHNIKLAADILNNAIVKANGGTWDFNDRSGDTNEAAGFWSAGSIIDGEYVDSIGGGICQVATTIFNAVYEAGLDVVERHNHTLYIASYPTGRDAAVSYPDLTLVWENNLRSDVLMKLSYTDESVTAQLYSVYTGYSATTQTGEWEEGKKYSTRFEVDDTLSNGMYYLKTTGADGSKVTVERTVTDAAGKTVKSDSFASVYAPKDEVYIVASDVDTSKLRSNRQES